VRDERGGGSTTLETKTVYRRIPLYSQCLDVDFRIRERMSRLGVNQLWGKVFQYKWFTSVPFPE